MSCKEEFIEIFKEKVTRPGADALLNYLENKSDFSPPRLRPVPPGLRGAGCASTA